MDAPYHLCLVCEVAIVNDTEICSLCTYVQAFLDNDSTDPQNH
jgi:predicted nucleic acid-binding Zn ribbon protein